MKKRVFFLSLSFFLCLFSTYIVASSEYQIEEYTGIRGDILFRGMVDLNATIPIECYEITFDTSMVTPGKVWIRIDDNDTIRERIGEEGKVYRYKEILIMLLTVGQNSVYVEFAANPYYEKVTIECDYPGKLAEPGDTLNYSLMVVNHDNWGKVLDLSIFEKPDDWDVAFKTGNDYVNKIFVPAEGFTNVDLEVITTTDVELGTYETIIRIGSGSLTLYTKIVSSYTSSGNTILKTDYTGLVGEAGETFIYKLTVINKTGCDREYDLSTVQKPKDWEVRFVAEEKRINKIFVPRDESLTLTVEVETTGDSDVGTKSVILSVGDKTQRLYITITETHKGEKGVLTLTVVNKDGNPVKGATIEVYSNNEIVEQGVTTSEGKIQLELAKGEYTAKIEKEGYYTKDIDEFEIKMGKTTDLGIETLNSKPYAVEISIDAPSKTVLLGESPAYRLTIENLGENDDTYSLNIKNLPEEWDYKYKSSLDATEAISQIYIKSGEIETVYLEIIAPYDVEIGDYSFKYLIKSSTGEEYEENLSVEFKGEYKMSLTSEKLAYEVKQGNTVEIELEVTNTGDAGSLTNIIPEVEAAEGWTASVDPEQVNSLKVGEDQIFVIKITPPGDIVPSDYEVTVKVKSDQLEESEEYRITVKKESKTTIYGIVIILIAIVVLLFMIRKYGRR